MTPPPVREDSGIDFGINCAYCGQGPDFCRCPDPDLQDALPEPDAGHLLTHPLPPDATYGPMATYGRSEER